MNENENKNKKWGWGDLKVPYIFFLFKYHIIFLNERKTP